MCGRYASFIPADRMHLLFRTTNPTPNLQPSWNIAPTRDAPVVRLHPGTGARHLDPLRWGLMPHWVKDPKSTRQPINARAERLATAPTFREAYARRRCLVPADVFYEWQVTTADRPDKVPWAIAREDRETMAFAGLWEGWRGPNGMVVRTFVIATTTANPLLQPLHDRMPVILEEADWPLWLGETEGDTGALLRPSAAALRIWRITTAVNNVRNDGPELLEPGAA